METAHDLYDRAEDAAAYIRNRTDLIPETVVVLGSGLGEVTSIVADALRMPYADIPNFPLTATTGHAGELLVGTGPGGRPLAILSGRIHLYEGYTVRSITFPIRALQCLGAKTLVVTNAAGGIGSGYGAGEFMAITDQINLTGEDPLVGENDPRLGERFLDMTQAYDPGLLALAEEVAGELGVPLHTGVYAGVRGPTFETRAEIERLRRMGADAVGMSTVNEVIAARHGGMRVLGLSAVTNVSGTHLDHVAESVLAATADVAGTLSGLLAAIIARLARD